MSERTGSLRRKLPYLFYGDRSCRGICKTLTRYRTVTFLPFHLHILSAISGRQQVEVLRALTRDTVPTTSAVARKPTFPCAATSEAMGHDQTSRALETFA